MAQTYTMDEAAGKLGISVDEMKRKLREEWKHIRSLRDGNTLRFKSTDIDELARTTGAGSSEDELKLVDTSDEQTKVAPAFKTHNPKKPASDDDIPLILDSGPDFLIDVPDIKTSSDSDVRLEKTEKSPKLKMDETELISLDIPKSTGASGKLGHRTDKLPKTPAKEEPSDGSEFELTLETDSDEFELSLNTDSSSEEVKIPGDKAKNAGRGGVNIDKPADSGVSLEKGKSKIDSSEDIEFEVNLEPSSSNSSRNLKSDSESEFELNLDESSESLPSLDGEKGDIFETDFELPALEDDSASEVQALDESSDTDLENSDFDLAIEGVDSDSDSDSEESSSEAVEAVEVDEPASAKGKKGKANVKKLKADDEDGGISFDEIDLDKSISSSKRGIKGDGDDAIEVEEDEFTPSNKGMVAAPADWGVLPVALLLPCIFLMFLGALMGYELLHSMWGYQQPSRPAGILVEMVAKTFGVEIKE